MTNFFPRDYENVPRHGSELNRTIDALVNSGLMPRNTEALAFRRILASHLEEEDEITPERYYRAANSVIMFCVNERVLSENTDDLSGISPDFAIAGGLSERVLVLSAHGLAFSTYGPDFASELAHIYKSSSSDGGD